MIDFFLQMILFSVAIEAITECYKRVGLIDLLKFRPFNCSFCMSAWFAVALAVMYFNYEIFAIWVSICFSVWRLSNLFHGVFRAVEDRSIFNIEINNISVKDEQN